MGCHRMGHVRHPQRRPSRDTGHGQTLFVGPRFDHPFNISLTKSRCRALQHVPQPCCLKEKRERHCHPTSRAPSRASLSSDRSRSLFLTLLKNRTVSWCLPGNLGCLFDFLICSSQPDRSRRSREVQLVPQPCCLKKARASSPARALRTKCEPILCALVIGSDELRSLTLDLYGFSR